MGVGSAQVAAETRGPETWPGGRQGGAGGGAGDVVQDRLVLGRPAERDELGVLFHQGRVARRQVKQVSGLKDLLPVGVRYPDPPLEHVAPVGARTQVVGHPRSSGVRSVPAGNETIIERRSPQSAPRMAAGSSPKRIGSSSRVARMTALLWMTLS